MKTEMEEHRYLQGYGLEDITDIGRAIEGFVNGMTMLYSDFGQQT